MAQAWHNDLNDPYRRFAAETPLQCSTGSVQLGALCAGFEYFSRGFVVAVKDLSLTQVLPCSISNTSVHATLARRRRSRSTLTDVSDLVADWCDLADGSQ